MARAYVGPTPFEQSNIDPKYQTTTYNTGGAYRTIIPEQFKNAQKVHQTVVLAAPGVSLVIYTVPEGFKFFLSYAMLSNNWNNAIVGLASGSAITAGVDEILAHYAMEGLMGSNTEILNPSNILVFNPGTVFLLTQSAANVRSKGTISGYIVPANDVPF